MNLILGIMAAVRSLTLVTSLLSADSSITVFTQPVLTATLDSVRIEVGLKNAFNAELKQLASTGTPVTLFLYMDLVEMTSGQTLSRSITSSELQYNPLSHQYNIIHTLPRDTLVLTSLDSACHAASWFKNAPAFTINGISSEKSYFLVLSAVLGTVNVEALGNHNLDLMTYWKYKRPMAKTAPFSGQSLMKRKRS